MTLLVAVSATSEEWAERCWGHTHRGARGRGDVEIRKGEWGMDKQLVVADPNEVPGDVALAPPGVMGPRQGTDDAVAFSAECVDPQPRMALRTHVEMGPAWGEERAKLLAKHDELKKKQAALRARLEARMRKLEEVHAALMAVIMDQVHAVAPDSAEGYDPHAVELTLGGRGNAATAAVCSQACSSCLVFRGIDAPRVRQQQGMDSKPDR